MTLEPRKDSKFPSNLLLESFSSIRNSNLRACSLSAVGIDCRIDENGRSPNPCTTLLNFWVPNETQQKIKQLHDHPHHNRSQTRKEINTLYTCQDLLFFGGSISDNPGRSLRFQVERLAKELRTVTAITDVQAFALGVEEMKFVASHFNDSTRTRLKHTLRYCQR